MTKSCSSLTRGRALSLPLATATSFSDGEKISLAKQPTTDERFERGKAFLERYRKTFEALAK